VKHFRHRKRGTKYHLMGRARMQIDSEAFIDHFSRNDALTIAAILERKAFVVYRGLEDDQLWIRPEKDFFDGRFEEVV